MASSASHPLALSGTAQAAAKRERLLRSLPDPHDRRYPRAWWFRLLRGCARVWWLPVAVYLAHSAAALVAWGAYGGLTAAIDGSHVAHALLVPLLFPALAVQPISTLALIASLVFAVVTMVVLCCVQAARWSANDSVREAEILLLRTVRSAEWGDGAWMWRAFAPALEWRLRRLRWRGRTLRTALLLAALVVGVLLGLGGVPTALPL